MDDIMRDPLGASMAFEHNLKETIPSTIWGSILRHRLLIVFALLSVYYKDESQLSVFSPYLRNGFRQVLKHSRETSDPENLKIGRSVIKALGELFYPVIFLPKSDSLLQGSSR
jgi:hypothetical protein